MFTQYSSTAWTRLLETQKMIVPCCVLSSFWGELLSSGLHLKRLLSLNAVSLQTSWPHAFCLAFTPLLNHRFDSVLSDCFPPSSASSQSPADDPRKSCCISALAYVIPTYLYVILCNYFFCRSSNTQNNIRASEALCKDESHWIEQSSRLVNNGVLVITTRHSLHSTL